MLDFLPVKVDIKNITNNQRITNIKAKVKFTGFRTIKKDLTVYNNPSIILKKMKST